MNCADAITKILDLCVITHDQLIPLGGRLSFSLTSLFGRFGGPMVAQLYSQLNATRSHPSLSGKETMLLQWWTAELQNMATRMTRHQTARPDWAVFTNAPTSTDIISAVTIRLDDFVT